MESAEQEVVARRARRVRGGFRLVFWTGAAAVLALVFSGGGKRFSDTEIYGQTSAGKQVMFVLEDDRPDVIETYLAATCPDGSLQEVWRDGDPAGRRITGVDSAGRRIVWSEMPRGGGRARVVMTSRGELGWLARDHVLTTARAAAPTRAAGPTAPS